MDVKKILFVNDNASLLNIYRSLFADIPNVSFIECHTVEQGLDAIKKSQADIVFLDHHLTDNGNEGLEILDALLGSGAAKGKIIYAMTGDAGVIPQWQKRGIEPVPPGIITALIQEGEAAMIAQA